MTWGRIYLWIAILIFAAAASVVARLVEIGEANLIDGRNPISFCNLLFAGNLVAALTLLALYHREWRPARLRSLSRRQWLIQTALALTSGAIAPAMMFTAIAHTSVTNIVLIETIEIPLGLLLAWLLYREKSSWSAVLGALCALGGVATTLVLQMDASPESMAAARMRGGVGHGEFFAAAATVLLVCGAEIGRKQLQTIPLGIFSVFRNIVGALFFLGIGLYVFGLGHFADIFSPLLWGWMLPVRRGRGGLWPVGVVCRHQARAPRPHCHGGVLFADSRCALRRSHFGRGAHACPTHRRRHHPRGYRHRPIGRATRHPPDAATQDRRQGQSLHRRLRGYLEDTAFTRRRRDVWTRALWEISPLGGLSVMSSNRTMRGNLLHPLGLGFRLTVSMIPQMPSPLLAF